MNDINTTLAKSLSFFGLTALLLMSCDTHQDIESLASRQTILLQQRGTSLGGAFGGESSVYRSRRGVEKMLFISTIVLSILFVGAAVASVIIR